MKKKNYITRVVCAVLFVLVPCLMWAESLRGTITSESGEELAYASIFVEELQTGTITNVKGQFELKNIPLQECNVRVSFIGYRTETVHVNLREQNVLNLRMQEESVTLNEFVVLPDGMDFAHYVMSKVEKNIKPLKQRVSSYECTVNGHLGKDINLEDLRKRRLIHTAAALMGWGKIFNLMVKYPQFSVDLREDVRFTKGKMKSGELQIVNMTPQLSEKEQKIVMKKDWFLDDNTYDRFYDEVGKKIKSLKSKNSKYELTYGGSYEEGDNIIYIIKYGHTQVEIVDGCWQIRRMKYHGRGRTIYFEFHELKPGVYLPISGRAEININYAKYPKGQVGLAMSYDYRNVK